MKQTTIDMLDSAMALNVEIQEDNLNLQEMKQHLLQLCKSVSHSGLESIYENRVTIKNQISLELLSMIDSGIADLDKKYRISQSVPSPSELSGVHEIQVPHEQKRHGRWR